MDEMYFGSAICEVTDAGELLLPRRFLETARARCIDDSLLIGLHEEAACLVAFDRVYVVQRHYELSEHAGKTTGGGLDHHRLRRLYGLVEEAPLAPDGMLQLPALLRARGAIGSAALLIASGARFEIWDLATVLAHGPSDLITVATLLQKLHKEVGHGAVMSSARPCAGAHSASQPTLCLQPLSALSPRHDPIGQRGAG